LEIFSNTWKIKGNHKRTPTGGKEADPTKKSYPNSGRLARSNELLSPFYLPQQ
jgi:hypothetical protein